MGRFIVKEPYVKVGADLAGPLLRLAAIGRAEQKRRDAFDPVGPVLAELLDDLASLARVHQAARSVPQVPHGTPILASGEMMPGVSSMSTAEVAKVSGRTPRTVTKAANLETLRGVRTVDGWRFDPSDVDDWVARRSSCASC